VGEPIGLETLHAATFVIDANEQIVTHIFYVTAQAGQLFAIAPVAGKQNDTANQRVFEALAVFGGEVQASDIDDQRSVLRHISRLRCCSLAEEKDRQLL